MKWHGHVDEADVEALSVALTDSIRGRPAIVLREGAVLETVFVGPGMRGHLYLSSVPNRLSLVSRNPSIRGRGGRAAGDARRAGRRPVAEPVSHFQVMVIWRWKSTQPARANALAIGTLPRSVAALMCGTSSAARTRVPSARISST